MTKQTYQWTVAFIFIIMLAVTMLMISSTAGAQDTQELRRQLESQKPGNTTFLMRGYAHSGFEIVDEQSSFVSGTFAPIFLWRQSDRILFEAEAEIAFSEEGTTFALEYANMSYILSDYLVVRFGNFLTPFGIFGPRLHPNWINKFSTTPLGFSHHSPVGPFAEFGVEFRGAAPLGSSRINYAFYLSNGPVLQLDTSVDPIAISTGYSNFSDNNDNKAVGGRIGLLPFGNNALELGFSTQYAKLGDRDTGFEDVGSIMYAGDLTFVKNSLSAIKGSIDLKAQYNHVNEDFFRIIDTDGVTSVDNDLSAWFVQFAYRPNLSSSDFISNMEFVLRYSAFNVINESSFTGGGDGHGDHTHGINPELLPVAGSAAGAAAGMLTSAAGPGDPHGTLDQDKTQWAIGLNYWLSWRSVLKISYQVTDNSEEIPGFYIHYALGF